MSENNSTNNSGIGFLGLLAVAFIVLKLIGIINWKWIWVLCPIWGSILFTLLILTIIFIIKSKE